MPMLVHGVAAWITGLALGQLAYRGSVVVLCLLLGGVALLRQRARSAAWLLLLAAGGVVGHGAQVRDARCRAALQQQLGRQQTLWFTPDAPPVGALPMRGALQGAVADEICHVAVTVRWAGSPPPDGHRVLMRGVARVTSRGLAIQQAAVVQVGPRDPLRATRAWAARTIDTHFRSRAPLVRALLIADQDGIPRPLRDRYADAGLVHLLSVSGMHVAIIASALLTLLGGLRVPRAAAEPVAMGGVVLYVLVLGCPAPAVRSAVMLVVMALANRTQRPLHAWAPLALGAGIPTIDPLVVTDLGWQLSVSGMAALVAARAGRRSARQWAHRQAHATLAPAARLARWLATRRGAGGWLVSEISTGVVATLVTAPLIAWSFGRLSLVAPLSNLVAGPLIAVLQPALFLALVFAPMPLAASLVADATQPLMALLDAVADVSGGIPGAVLSLAPTLSTACATGLASACVVRASAASRRAPWLCGATAALVGAVWLPLLDGGSGRLELHVIDVGQGDALALRTPKGRWMLMDAGPSGRAGDAGTRVVLPYLRRLGGAVALVVLSHAHEDHAGGASAVVRATHPVWWWEPAFVTTSPGYRAALGAVGEAHVRWKRVHPGERFTLDGVTVTVLAPDSAWTAAQHNANETSVVLRVAYGAHAFLLTGDAERDEEHWLLTHQPSSSLAADVLKLGHHGSRTSSSPAFLDVVRPRVALASVGAGNRYGHPAPETLAELAARGVPVFRTDLDGSIVVRSDGRALEVQAGDATWIVPARVRPDDLP
jgi:competence protein ComEC